MTDAQNQIIGLLKQILDAGGGEGGAAWGGITGTLGDQTDLDTALGLKQTAAQVQALIDAALAGKGVIGTANFTIDAGAITGLFSNGIIASVTYSSAGRYNVVFASNQPDTNYTFNAICFANGITVQLQYENKGIDGFRILAFNTVDATLIDVTTVEVHVMRLSQ